MKTDRTLALALLILRLALGTVLIYYGSQKLLGAFGGYGLQATLDAFEKNLGVPNYIGILAVISEFFGSIGVVLGLLTRVSALGIFVTMSTAVYAGVRDGIHLQMQGTDDPIRIFTYPLLLGCIALALVLVGPGPISLDAKLFKPKAKRKAMN